MKKTMIMAALCSLLTTGVYAHDGVMHDMDTNTAQMGKFSLGYSYEFMKMDGMRDGTDELSPAQVRARGFMMSPIDMDMQMHMFHLGYQANHRLALMAMLSYLDNEMTMENGASVRSKMKSDGFGDLTLSGRYELLKEANSMFGMTAGLSIPTGSIDEKNTAGVRLPYMMQLGSGTWDPMIGMDYSYHYGSWVLGINANAVFRLRDNTNNYHLGNEYHMSLSASHPLGENFTGQLRLDGKNTGEIEGRDTSLALGMSPANRADFYGGQRVDAVMGISFNPGQIPAVLNAEFGLPIYEYTNGPRLETDYRFKLGAHFMF